MQVERDLNLGGWRRRSVAYGGLAGTRAVAGGSVAAGCRAAAGNIHIIWGCGDAPLGLSLGGSGFDAWLGLDHRLGGLVKLGLAEAWGQGVGVNGDGQLPAQDTEHPPIPILPCQSRQTLHPRMIQNHHHGSLWLDKLQQKLLSHGRIFRCSFLQVLMQPALCCRRSRVFL